MILTPVAPYRLRRTLAAFAGAIEDSRAARVLRRLARAAPPRRARGAAARAHHEAAVRLARRVGMGVRGIGRYGWDGRALYARTEAYVLLHEIAHYQVAPPARRRAVDFGLGPGPDTADRDAAERHARLFGAARDREEALASLLGILWEAELGQPALASLVDQNWFEGAGRKQAARHFAATVLRLAAGRFVGAAGRPARRLSRARHGPD